MAEPGSAKRTISGVPTVNAALRAVAQDHDADDVEADRITIRLLASGEVAYRIHPRDGDFYHGGVVSV
jgi:hypothetical protein